MKRLFAAMTAALLMVALVSSTAMAAPPTVKIGALQPTWALGVFSAYVGPPAYEYASPGSTAVYLGRQAGLIKAGLTIDPTSGVYEDEGLFAFKPAMTIDTFATLPLTYDVVNQYGTSPVWMTIEIEVGDPGTREDNVVFQMVPDAYASTAYSTINARAASNWLQWTNWVSGDTTGATPMSLAGIATAYTGQTVVRTYLRLGMGISYASGTTGTQAWVDKASIGGVTYDFVVKGSGYALKDWTTNPGNHGFQTP